MKSKLVLSFAIAGIALLSAKSYSINLYQPATVGAAELKAGEYQVEVSGQKAVIRQGKMHTETPVTVATADRKYDATSVLVTIVNGKQHVQEIHLGGTNTKLIVRGETTAASK